MSKEDAFLTKEEVLAVSEKYGRGSTADVITAVVSAQCDKAYHQGLHDGEGIYMELTIGYLEGSVPGLSARRDGKPMQPHELQLITFGFTAAINSLKELHAMLEKEKARGQEGKAEKKAQGNGS